MGYGRTLVYFQLTFYTPMAVVNDIYHLESSFFLLCFRVTGAAGHDGGSFHHCVGGHSHCILNSTLNIWCSHLHITKFHYLCGCWKCNRFWNIILNINFVS